MNALPAHSHHRAPLLNQLSQHIPSSTAATLLGASASYVRECKRQDVAASDLLQQHYPHGVHRQRLAPERQTDLCEYIATSCPTKSGESSVTYHQYTTDALLYSAYRQFTSTPVSFNTFHRVKQWMRVRRAGRYLGQFDCSKCVALKKLAHKPVANFTAEEEQEYRKCQRHQQTSFLNASIIS